MKSERCLDIPEKHEVIVPVAPSSDRFAIWRVARERWGPAFRFREPYLDLLFCGLVLSGHLEQDGGPDGVQRVGPGQMILNGAGGPRSLAVHEPPGVEILVWDALKGVATDRARSEFPPLPISFPLPEAGAMESLFVRLLEEADSGGPEVSRICACLAEALLLKAARACREHTGRRSRREQQFLRARRYVLDRLAQPLTSEDRGARGRNTPPCGRRQVLLRGVSCGPCSGAPLGSLWGLAQAAAFAVGRHRARCPVGLAAGDPVVPIAIFVGADTGARRMPHAVALRRAPHDGKAKGDPTVSCG